MKKLITILISFYIFLCLTIFPTMSFSDIGEGQNDGDTPPADEPAIPEECVFFQEREIQ